MIDMHCHILPAIDDGAEDMNESLTLCSVAEKQGITDIITTPHFAEYDEVLNFAEIRKDKLNMLNRALRQTGIDVNVTAGSELYLDDMIFSAPNLDALTLNGSRYMLCEFSLKNFDPEDAMDWIDEIIKRDYVPIIAHPERYSVFMRVPEYINELASKDVLFQINADSLTGANGKSSFYLACDMLSRNLVDFIASDAHSSKFRPNDLLDKTKFFPEFITVETLELLLDENPSYVLNDRLITPPERGLL